jgi:hypothetical protein
MLALALAFILLFAPRVFGNVLDGEGRSSLRRVWRRVILAVLLGTIAPHPALADSVVALCLQCIKIRIGVPIVARGPSPGIPDSQFTAIKLPAGQFRGFSASTTTYAIDGAKPWAMGGTAVPVLRPAPPGSYGESGEWINHVERAGDTLLAWVHDETGDRPGQGLKSMSLALSKDDGMSWQRLGQIITGTEPLMPGNVTGEGDCSAVNGGDGYFYAYCGRARDHANFVARAPVTNPGSGHWTKWFNGAWNEPGLGGDATRLSARSSGLARWIATGQTVGLGEVPGGIGLFLSGDHTTFAPLPEPLLPNGPGSWNRPDPNEFSSYFGILDIENGSNQLAGQWMLSYAYIQPNEGFSQRYLVFRPLDVSISPTPIKPQIGVILTRWRNAAQRERWSTIAPVPANTGFTVESQSGYLLTMADPAEASIELEDCVRQRSGHADHLLAHKGECEAHGYQRLRRAGFVYVKQQRDTQPLYQCDGELENSHFASNRSDCDGQGKNDGLLGYDLIR